MRFVFPSVNQAGTTQIYAMSQALYLGRHVYCFLELGLGCKNKKVTYKAKELFYHAPHIDRLLLPEMALLTIACIL